MNTNAAEHDRLWKIGREAIDVLTVENGILASGKEELYGCIFGRDSLITALLLIRAAQGSGDASLISLVRTILKTLADLQGKEVNLESGEEPGKIIHEFRPVGHEHLTKQQEHPWYLYSDGIMRNYDTVDATPLFLMAMHAYLCVSGDNTFIESLMPEIQLALAWLRTCGDANKDGFIDYQFHPNRTFGGLRVQSWMDSTESVFFEESDDTPTYSIAPVEVQAYTYRALRDWASYFATHLPSEAVALKKEAEQLKSAFNTTFVQRTGGMLTIPFALDGDSRPLTSPRSSIGHILWRSVAEKDGKIDTIIDPALLTALTERLMATDLFVPEAGIRTLSTHSRHFAANSYHNGSIWPHDTALSMLGLLDTGFVEEAGRVRDALLNAYQHFNTPLELFVYDKGFKEYMSEAGQGSCRTQAWSAAALLAMLSIDI